MPNFFTDNEDIQFHLNKVDFSRLFKLTSGPVRETLGAENEEDYKSVWLEVLTTLGDMCANHFHPNAGEVERQDITLKEGVVTLPEQIQKNKDMLMRAGFNAAASSHKFGGLSSPFIMDMASMEILNRACPSTSINACWWGPISHIIEKFGDDQIAESFCTKIVEQGWSGSMALTEPDAGSDLGALKAYGELQDDGTYLLHGTKRFISNGDSEISLVLARSGKEDHGLEALSLFLCPRTKDDGSFNFEVSKIEEKVGLHGSATCELNFDGSKAYLLGKAGEGFRYMLVLMNEARLGVSFQAIGNLEAVYQLSEKYASERQSWGKVLKQHSLIGELLMDMKSDLYAVRSLGYKAAYQYSLMHLLSERLQDEDLNEDEKQNLRAEYADAKRKTRLWNPLLKYYTAEKGVHHARMGLQIHGGYGFSKEYDIERLLRESLIYPIYEGTSQIQALMCVKDTLKEAIRRPSELIESSVGLSLKSLTSLNPLQKDLYKLKRQVNASVLTVVLKMLKQNMSVSLKDFSPKEILGVIKNLGGLGRGAKDFSLALQHAERICTLKCYSELGESLVEDAQEDETRADVAKWFLRRAISDSKRIRSDIEEMELFNKD